MEPVLEELEAAKRYMRVDDDTDDLVIWACLQAARGYMAEAGVAMPKDDTPRRTCYDLVCHAMALSLYDRRELTAQGAVNESPVLRGMLNQLKLTEPDVSNLDTSGKEG